MTNNGSQFTEQDLELRLSSSPLPHNGPASQQQTAAIPLLPLSSPPSNTVGPLLPLSSPPSSPVGPPLGPQHHLLLSDDHPVLSSINGSVYKSPEQGNRDTSHGARVRRTPNEPPEQVSGNRDTPRRARVRRTPPEQGNNDTPRRSRVRRTPPEQWNSDTPAEDSNNRSPNQSPEERTIIPPFEWATEYRATIHSREYLVSNRILKITGDVYCKDCHKQFQIKYDLVGKFNEVGLFIAKNKDSMHDRAPKVWMNPGLLPCADCKKNSVKPVIAETEENINWLFLLLGQMLGFCTLDQLKYFCKNTNNHRTGAKDRVLYLTYLTLCKQLDPSGPFDR